MKDKRLAKTICNVWNEHHTGLFEQADPKENYAFKIILKPYKKKEL